MSRPICRMIEATKPQAIKACADAETLITQIPSYNSQTEVAENLQVFTTYKFDLTHACSQLRDLADILEKQNLAWGHFLERCSPEQLSNEEQLYNQYADGEDNFISCFTKCRNLMLKVHSVEQRVSHSIRTMESRSQSVETASDTSEPTQQAPPAHRLSTNVTDTAHLSTAHQLSSNGNLTVPNASQGLMRGPGTVNLPTLQIPKFDGTISRYRAWRQLFMSSVDNQPISNVQKLTYLFSVVTGNALGIISALDSINENYPIALDLLERRYGNEEVISQHLYHNLEQIPRANYGVSSLQKTYDMLEQVLMQLEAAGENLNHKMVTRQIINKFPTIVIAEIDRQRENPDVPWNSKELRKVLENVIKHHVRVENYVHQAESQEKRGFLQKPKGVANNVLMCPDNVCDMQVEHNHNDEFNSEQLGIQGETYNVVIGTRARAQLPCIFCGKKSHSSSHCESFTTTEARQACLKDKGLCIYCFKGHNGKCFYNPTCTHCHQRGHLRPMCFKFLAQLRSSSTQQEKDLHRQPNNKSNQAAKDGAKQEEKKRTLKNKCDSGMHSAITVNPVVNHSKTSMLTATVTVFNPQNCTLSKKVKAFFDCGSQRTFISSSLAKSLKLSMDSCDMLSVQTFASPYPKQVKTAEVSLGLKLLDGSTLILNTNTTEQLAGTMCREPLSKGDWEFLNQKGLSQNLGDVLITEAETFKPDILIGLNHFFDLAPAPLLRKAEALPSGLHLIPTEIGYLIGGSENLVSSTSNNFNCPDTVQFIGNAVTHNLNEVSTMWDLDLIGINDCPKQKDDDTALSQFYKRLEFKNGRYYMAWLWKNDPPNLPSNQKLAYNQLISQLRKSANDPDGKPVIEARDAVIKGQLDSGVIELVQDEQTANGPVSYVPHHVVITPGKTTVYREVYNCSAHKRGEQSFNDNTYRGPILLPELPGLLIRFRKYQIGISADVAKAFLQMMLHEDQRDCCRFYWIKDANRTPIYSPDNIVCYRFTRVLFGAKSSPSMLNLCINHHLMQSVSPIAQEMRHHMYVDNYITSVNTVDEAKVVYQTGKQTFGEMTMNLRQWATNNHEFKNLIPQEDWAKSTDTTKILGVKWDLNNDKLFPIQINLQKLSSVKTKRQLAEAVGSLFDPLGIGNPLSIGPKLLIQKVWQAKLEWDDNLPQELLDEWQHYADDLQLLEHFCIPRSLALQVGKDNELIGFVDGSKSCFAANIYIRTKVADSAYKVNLLFAKVRVAPTREITVPRMELLALWLGVKIIQFCAAELQSPIQSKTIFLDSQCVLHWLKANRKLPVFVENRIRQIKEPGDINFRFVSTDQNPADLATRPTSLMQFEERKEVWLHGPKFLQKETTEWPDYKLDEVTPELIEKWENDAKTPGPLFHASNIAMVIKDEPGETKCIINISKFSRLTKLKRVLIYCFRMLKVLTLKANTGKKLKDFLNDFSLPIRAPLSAKEMLLVKTYLDRCVQNDSFPEVVSSLKGKGKPHPLTQKLNLFMDVEGVIRLTGRLQMSQLSEDAKHPKLMPNNHPYTKLLINYLHSAVHHGGAQRTLAEVKQEYYIVCGKQAVKRAIKQCPACILTKGPPYKLPSMPPLPSSRVTRSNPFEFTGIDIFGPYKVHCNATTLKIWGVLMTCMVSRAIHLDFITNMTGFAIVNCIRRFIGKCGKPKLFLSDNARGFKLADEVLQTAFKKALHTEQLQTYCADHEIEWRFISELSPWKGGVWERLVGVTKSSLKQAIGKKILHFEEWLTLMAEVEGIINSRPLCNVDDSTFQIIRPIDLLIPQAFIGTEILEESHEDKEFFPTLNSTGKVLEAYKTTQKYLDKYWDLFYKNYLVSLHERHTYKHKKPKSVSTHQPVLGEIVLIHKEDAPRGVWKLGKIIKLLNRKDGEITTAELLLPNKKTINRPINLLYPLEILSEVSIQNDSNQKSDECSKDDSENSKRSEKSNANQKRGKLQNDTLSCIVSGFSMLKYLFVISLIFSYSL